MIEILLLNAVIANRDFSVLVKHGLNNVKHFPEQSCAYEFVEKHIQEFGELPSLESVMVACPEFEAMEVVESIDTLCLKLAEKNLKMEQKTLLKDVASQFGSMDAYQVLETMQKQIEKMSNKASRRSRNGVNWSTDGEQRAQEYMQRKSKDFSVKIPFFFEEITEATGGAERGDVCTIMASTGKGKSWLGLLQSLVAHKAGFIGLIESAEMSKPENEFRLDTIDGGFSNRGLWTGQLQNETSYLQYLERFNKDSNAPDLIIKTPEDWPNGLTLQQIENDIIKTHADFVVIDQFNLMRFRGNSKDDKASFSRNLKQLAAKMGVVVFLLYQANGDYVKGASGKDDEGIRELRLPTLGDYSETIAVIQDSAKIFGFDAVTWKDEETGRKRGKAIVGVLKSRSGGEGLETEVIWMPNDGLIRPRTATDMF